MTTDIVQRLDMNALIAKAVGDNAAVETLERLFQLAKDVRAENARAAWHQAMAKFQANVPEIKKTKVARAGAYSYNYAPLDEILAAVRPALSACGLSATFEIVMDSAQVTARCIIGHEDGHSQSTEFTIPIDMGSRMNAAQQVASASTYARRYAILAALGLAPEDDDDAAATGDAVGRGEPSSKLPDPSNWEQVREYQDDEGRPIWRGRLLAERYVTGPKTGGGTYNLAFFKGQDGQEFATFDVKMAASLKASLRTAIELTWEPNKKNPGKGRDIVSWKPVTVEAA